MKIKNNEPSPDDGDVYVESKLQELNNWIDTYVGIYSATDHGRFMGYKAGCNVDAIIDFVISLVEKNVIEEYEAMKKSNKVISMRKFCKEYEERNNIPRETVRSQLKRAGCY